MYFSDGWFLLHLDLHSRVFIREETLFFIHILNEFLVLVVIFRWSFKFPWSMFLRWLFGISSWLSFAVRLWVHGSFHVDIFAEEISKFIESNFCITVSVNSADNCKDLTVNQSCSLGSHKLWQVRFSYFTCAKSIDAFKGSLRCIIWTSFKLINQHFHSLNKVNFVLNDVLQAKFDVIW